MNVLWITNIVFPEALSILHKDSELKSSGGWMLGSAEELIKNDNVYLTVATPSSLVNELTYIKGAEMSYYLFPLGRGNIRYNPDYEFYWREINKQVSPDVVHIHGTEFSHGLAYVNACGARNVVVSIQGLVSACCYYYYYGISLFDIIKNITIRDLLRGTLFQEKKSFRKRGEIEKDLLRKVNHVIGRTTWDEARSWEINPDIKYHFCNETLRPEFYDGSEWKYENCHKHSIFISQAGYPIKGLHQVLKAMPLIIREFPDTTVRIAGLNITEKRMFKGVIPYISGYGQLIRNLICKLKLEDRVSFVGNLNAETMKQEYLRSNVFVCPSSIENSPNSLGEAQILGVPCVCSYAGGMPNMMKGYENHLYRFEETAILAMKICNIFNMKSEVNDMRGIAKERHDRQHNTELLLHIYNELSL